MTVQQQAHRPYVVQVTIPRDQIHVMSNPSEQHIVFTMLQRENPGCRIQLSTTTPDACIYHIVSVNAEQYDRILNGLDGVPKDWEVVALGDPSTDSQRHTLVLTFPAGRQFVLLPLWLDHPTCHVIIAAQTDTTTTYHITPTTAAQYVHIKDRLEALVAGNADWHLAAQAPDPAPSADTIES